MVLTVELTLSLARTGNLKKSDLRPRERLSYLMHQFDRVSIALFCVCAPRFIDRYI